MLSFKVKCFYIQIVQSKRKQAENREANTMQLQGKKIHFLGDSITEGVGASSSGTCYVAQVAERSGAVCRNYGISGTRIARQTHPSDPASFDLDFCMRVDGMDPDADVVVVFGGTNDYGHGDAPFGVPSDRTPDTFYGALHTLYTALICRYPQSKIVVLTPLHRCGEEISVEKRPGVELRPLKQYVEAIREAAEYYSLPVLDLFAVSGLQPNVPVIRERDLPDGLHPNDAGHARLAELIVRFLQQL